MNFHQIYFMFSCILIYLYIHNWKKSTFDPSTIVFVQLWPHNYETGHNGHPNFQNQINLYSETDLGDIELT